MDDPTLDPVTLQSALKDVTLVNKWLEMRVDRDNLPPFWKEIQLAELLKSWFWENGDPASERGNKERCDIPSTSSSTI